MARNRRRALLTTLQDDAGGGGAPAQDAVAFAQRLIDTYGALEVWKMTEASGAVALATAASARNGAYTGVDLAQGAGPGILSGDAFPSYDGTNDYTDLYTSNGSTGLADVWNGAEGAIWMILQASGAGVWTDGVRRRVFLALVNVSNFVVAEKASAANIFTLKRKGGGTQIDISKTSFSPTTPFTACLTWSEAADELKAFTDGAQFGGTQNLIGAWSGALASTQALFGASSQTPTEVWSGYGGMLALWAGSVPSPTDIANIDSDLLGGW